MEHLKKDVDETIVKNDLIFDIDWQGTTIIKIQKSSFNKNLLSN